MSSSRRVVGALLAVLLSVPALAAVDKVGTSSATFSGKGPAGFKLDGKTEDLKVKEDGKSVTVTVPLKDLTTGIELRDSHMRDKYLEVGKYPDAVFELPYASVTLPADGKKTSGKGKGKLTLHGKTKEVPFTYTIQRKGDTYTANGTMPVNLKDHDISVPNYLGVTVKPDIETAVTFQFKKS